MTALWTLLPKWDWGGEAEEGAARGDDVSVRDSVGALVLRRCSSIWCLLVIGGGGGE